jgi:hypothetical protein
MRIILVIIAAAMLPAAASAQQNWMYERGPQGTPPFAYGATPPSPPPAYPPPDTYRLPTVDPYDDPGEELDRRRMLDDPDAIERNTEPRRTTIPDPPVPADDER